MATDSIDAGVREAGLALAIEPFALLTNTRMVSFLYYGRRYEEALQQAQKTIELDSTYFHIDIEGARVFVELRRCEEAVAAISRAANVTGPIHQGIRGYTYAKCGRRPEAVAELNRLLDDAKAGGNVSHYALAVIHAGLGSKDAAFAELESAYAERAWSMLLLKRDPAFDSLRGNPRFRAARTKSGARIVTSVRRAKLADAAIYHR